MKVNLIAYALHEGMGSEPGSGWAALRGHLSLNHQIRVITTETNKKNFERTKLWNHPNIEIVSISTPHVLNCAFKKIPHSTQILYHLWVLRVTFLLRRILKNTEGEEIVHHATYAGDWNLTPLAFLSQQQRAFWGPIGGCQKINLSEFRNLNIKGKLSEGIRLLILSPIRIILRFMLSRKNITILTTNDEVTKFFEKYIDTKYCPNLFLMEEPEMTVKTEQIIFSSGRLIPLKNFPLQIISMNYLDPSYKLIIAGEGGEKEELQKLIEKHNLSSRVHLVGEISRNEAINYLKNSSVFAFTSIRDSHSWSLAEAVHLGIPVATIGTPGNIAVLNNGHPTYIPKRNVTSREFAEYLMNPIRFHKRNCFSLESLTSNYSRIFESGI